MFAMLPDQAIKDRDLPLSSLKMLALLALHRNNNEDHKNLGWSWPSITTLAAEYGCSETYVKRSLKDLADRGYLEKRHRRANGHQATNLYRVVYDRPGEPDVHPDQSEPVVTPANPSRVNSELPLQGEPVVTPKRQALSDKGNTESDTSTGSPTSDSPSDRQNRSAQADHEFELWWDEWSLIAGSKRSKGQARRAWTTARKKASAEILIERVRAYLQRCDDDGTSLRYIKHPATWLNGECWDDDTRRPPGPGDDGLLPYCAW